MNDRFKPVGVIRGSYGQLEGTAYYSVSPRRDVVVNNRMREPKSAPTAISIRKPTKRRRNRFSQWPGAIHGHGYL